MLYSDERRLHVVVPLPDGPCEVFVGHAPSSYGGDVEEQAAKAWWRETRRLILAGHRVGRPLVLLFDANGRVGGVPSLAVGGVDPQEEDVNGSELHGLLNELDLCVPATFLSPPGNCWTWRSGRNGAVHRIDYVAVPLDWAYKCTAAFCDDDLVLDEAGLGRVDHRASVVGIAPQVRAAPPESSFKGVVFCCSCA